MTGHFSESSPPTSSAAPPAGDRGFRRLVTVTGPDRPGLVAAVSRVLAEAGADLEDVSMTRLSGNFSTMLLARGGREEALRTGLEGVAREHGLRIHLDAAVEHGAGGEPEPDAFVAAVGPNRTGIVAALSEVLACHGANILEMATRLLERTQVPVYDVRLEATVPPDAWVPLERDLQEAAQRLGVEVRLERLERTDF